MNKSTIGVLLFILISSCDHKTEETRRSRPNPEQEDEIKSAFTPTSYNDFRRKAERIFQQKASPRNKMARIAPDAVACLRNDNKEGFDEIIKALSDMQVSGYEFGIELLAATSPDDRAKLISWLNSIPDRIIRFNATAGSLGKMITIDPEMGLKLISRIDREFLSSKDSNNVVTLEEMTWMTTGRLLIEDRSMITTTDSILSLMPSDSKILKALSEGVASAAAKAIDAGKDIHQIIPIIAELPSDLHGNSLERIVQRLDNINERGTTSAISLIKAMKDFPDVSDNAFFALGKKVDFRTFSNSYLSQNLEVSSRNNALIKGWALQSPERAFRETFDSRPELASSAFEAWIESDSMKASEMLAGMDDGMTKYQCISKLCEYLVSINSMNEDKEWLEILPQAERVKIQPLIDGKAKE